MAKDGLHMCTHRYTYRNTDTYIHIHTTKKEREKRKKEGEGGGGRKGWMDGWREGEIFHQPSRCLPGLVVCFDLFQHSQYFDQQLRPIIAEVTHHPEVNHHPRLPISRL